MRRTLDRMTWVLVVLATWGVFWLASVPDVESSLGIPLCASQPNHVSCRYCENPTHVKLPPVINANNVRLVRNVDAYSSATLSEER